MKKSYQELSKMILACLVLNSMAFGVYAVDPANADLSNLTQAGKNVIKQSSDETVTLGKGSAVKYSNGPSEAHGDIAIGEEAVINNYASQGGSIAIGRNAKVENMAGGQEANLGMGQTTFSGGVFSSTKIPADPTKVIGSVVIGNNTFARSGSIMIGSHNYSGKMGDETIDVNNARKYALNMYATSLGANSYANGLFTSITGAFSIMSSDYNGGRRADLFGNVKNFGAVISGSFNSIESLSGTSTAGVANALVGVANRTEKSNGSIVLGAGNEISNSMGSVGASRIVSGKKDSAKEFADTLRKAIKDGEGAGGMGIIGGGNKADWATKSQIIGINNRLTGENGNTSTLNYISGYKNVGTKVKHIYMIGAENEVSDSEQNIVLGDKYKISAKTNKNIAIGFNTAKSDETIKAGTTDTVMVGNDIKAKTSNSVYLGKESTDAEGTSTAGAGEYKAGMEGYNDKFAGKKAVGVVSVGKKDGERRVQNVAAGLISKDSTDAINGSQLWALAEKIKTPGAGGTVTNITYAGDDNKKKTVAPTVGFTFKGDSNINISTEDGGIVNYHLNPNITNITSVGGPTSKITFNDKKNEVSVNGGKITNVADGEVSKTSKEAVNGSQLFATNERIKEIEHTAIGGVGELRDEMNAGLSMGAALSALKPLQYRPYEKTQIMAGVGRYKHNTSYALGLAVHSNENLLINGGIGFGKGSTLLVNAGITWRVGTEKDKNLPEKFRQGPITAVYALKDEVESLQVENKVIREENRSMHDQVEKMMQELKTVKEQLAQVLAKK